MTEHGGGTADFARMSLEEFTKQIPPGWKPNMKNYSFKDYMEKLRLWWSFAEVAETQVGPLVAARLKGQALRLAMAFYIDRDGTRHVGVNALILPAVVGTTDPLTGATIPPQPAGITAFIQYLTREYEIHDHDSQTEKLADFFGLRRGSSSLAHYITEWKRLYEEAETYGDSI